MGTPIDTVLYTYGDDSWGDLLTAYDGVSRTYDEIGNVLSDGTWTYTWQNGRELASVSNGSATWSFTYDANGMRTSRTNGSYTYRYVYNGGQLMQLTMGGHTLNFAYDAAGTPMTVTFDGTMYYYITNLQGDVMAIADSSGTIVVSYAYDAWGKLLSVTGSMANTLGAVNPLRYRSYVYDYETGYYYLQSRYYDPQIGRFINADGLIATGQGLLGNNMFAYCGNNPAARLDIEGTRHCAATSISKEQSYDRKYSCYWQRQVALEKRNPKPIGSYTNGNVYLVTNPNEVLTDFSNDVIVVDNRGPEPNDNVEIRYSCLITDQALQREILTLLYNYEQENPTGWSRTVDSMMIEWEVHNTGAFWGNYVPFAGSLYYRSIHVCFDNNSEGWSTCEHYSDGIRKILG